MLLLIAIALAMLWAVFFFALHASGLIHLVLVFAIIIGGWHFVDYGRNPQSSRFEP